MTPIVINRTDLRNKIYGCWLGKNIGGTLGGPFEGRKEMQNVTAYTTPKGEPLPNDDLDLQLIWLKAVQEHGPLAITNRLLGEYWLNFIPPYWNEYGICKANMKAGLIAPLCGEYHNEWQHSNGAWIRTEIWACLAPGCPDVAIKYAYEDASVDHGSGEGTNAALFTAAVESAAFVISDRDELIKIGLSKIPADCRIAKSINIVLDAHKNGKTWQEARELVVKDSEDLGWFQAPGNVAFAIIGWMFGEGDFGKSICIATNCGDDTDCTAATLGAILGIILGQDNIPAEWIEPIGDRIITVAIDRGSHAPPATLAQLTDEVMAQVPASLIGFKCPVELSDGATDLSGLSEISMTDQKVASEIWGIPKWAVIHELVHTTAVVDYGKEPTIKAGEPFKIKVTLINNMSDCRHMQLDWHLPMGWSVSPSEQNHVTLWNWQTAEVEVEITAEYLESGTNRGILEIAAPDRPTVGFIPLVLFAE